MAKVAKPNPVPTTSLQVGGVGLKVGAMAKRKTPSELRGEQLKRVNLPNNIDDFPAPFRASPSDLSKKPDLSKNPRYVDTRMDELYPAKKSRFRISSGKENAKEGLMEQTTTMKNHSLLSNLVAKKKKDILCPEGSICSSEIANRNGVQASQSIDCSSQSGFRSVADLSWGDNKLSGLATVDMNKALQGLVARESSDVNGLPASSSEKSAEHTLANLGSFCIPGRKAPLDLTLKTSMRVVSSSPISRVHQSLMPRGYNVLSSIEPQLHSWVYPQSTLPPSLMAVLTSTAAEGVELDFLRKRHLAWEDSFRSLYYMLRNGICRIFYVCTPQFVVMFTSSHGAGKSKRVCNAYITQSTRSLRALLKERDVCFSMPLCLSKIEQATTEDLVELSEIEKHNLGQTRRLSSSSDIDHSPESFLAFRGNKNVHGLYDIVLNYRSFLTSLMGMDVPVLYSPVVFQNAASSSPEIKCVELKRADHIFTSDKGLTAKDGESTDGLPSGFCSSVEIKDAFIPPWVICGICYLMGSEEGSFEASFMTEPTSITLNAALEVPSNEKSSAGSEEDGDAFGIPKAVVSTKLHSGLLKGLKYSNGSYTATRSPV